MLEYAPGVSVRWPSAAPRTSISTINGSARNVMDGSLSIGGTGMKLLTGQHRIDYEALLSTSAHNAGQLLQLKSNLKQMEEQYRVVARLLEREKERADKAVDELLALRGVPPVSPSPMQMNHEEAMFEEEADKVELYRKRVEAGEHVDLLREVA